MLYGNSKSLSSISIMAGKFSRFESEMNNSFAFETGVPWWTFLYIIVCYFNEI